MTGLLRALAGQVTLLVAVVTLAVIFTVGHQVWAVALQVSDLVTVEATVVVLIVVFLSNGLE